MDSTDSSTVYPLDLIYEGSVELSEGPEGAFYNYLFSSTDSLKQRNEFVFLFFQYHLKVENYSLISQILHNGANNELHRSLLKAMLVMTDGVEVLLDGYEKVLHIFNKNPNIK